MIEKTDIGNLRCIVARCASEHICYILSPMEPDSRQVELWSREYGITLAVITGMDWDNDLTPWPAQNVPPSDPPFEGHAAEFLQRLETDVIPAIEGDGRYTRTLCGISLSGLFTLWAWMQTDTFANIGSLSGSFWYEGFMQWLEANARAKAGRAYFSLGTKEGGPRGPKPFSRIQEQPRETVTILKSKGIACTFAPVPGTHFAPAAPRIEKMLDWLAEAQ